MEHNSSSTREYLGSSSFFIFFILSVWTKGPASFLFPLFLHGVAMKQGVFFFVL
ncbi:hypothetical protein RchiOBHm_Chr5g0048421 [Rosa chinensis]|uniref:Uncharacterized protein n=1 Tax=Rosa chinensis TaxID=74649 RepID=A0A2P6QEL6_ROSCH|nr:hypothetical protein RchiOBHm_Chr5g0048421 [Rosa chinensis]